MSPWLRMPPVYGKTRASSPECAASLSISCASTKSIPSFRIVLPPLVAASITCSPSITQFLKCRALLSPDWGVETKLHYVRDVTMAEDASRIRKNPGIFARMRSFAYNILRLNQIDTIVQDRFAAACGGIDYLLSLNYSVPQV